MSSYQKSPRRKLLVTVHADGWIEAYADPDTDVRIEMVPTVGSPAGEVLAEQYVELTIPRTYREIYRPGSRRAAALFRTIRPSDIAVRDWQAALLRSLERAQAIVSGGGDP